VNRELASLLSVILFSSANSRKPAPTTLPYAHAMVIIFRSVIRFRIRFRRRYFTSQNIKRVLFYSREVSSSRRPQDSIAVLA
jgi:hypothetical protein